MNRRLPFALALLGLLTAFARTPVSVGAGEAPPPAQVEVLYFHRTARCSTCLKMEAYTSEAVKHSPKEQKPGRLLFRAINLDEEEYKHYEKEYAIEFNSVVLSLQVKGQEVAWTNLPSVWAIVGDKQNFIAYVETEIAKQLELLPKE